MLNVQIDDSNIQMELDTGAPCSIIKKKKSQANQSSYCRIDAGRQFMSYIGHHIKCIPLFNPYEHNDEYDY